jgi:hypothetical protein
MPMDKEAYRVWRDRIRGILNQQWDPIGGCPPDEYNSSATLILSQACFAITRQTMH